MKLTREQQAETLTTLETLIARCEKALPQFAARTSQHTLLVNRLGALRVGQVLMTRSKEVQISRKEIEAARAPLASILRKCEKAVAKHVIGSATYKKLEKQIHAMRVVLARIEEIIAELE